MCLKFTTADNSNFDKRCSDAHFVSFLSYYYCKMTKTSFWLWSFKVCWHIPILIEGLSDLKTCLYFDNILQENLNFCFSAQIAQPSEPRSQCSQPKCFWEVAGFFSSMSFKSSGGEHSNFLSTLLNVNNNIGTVLDLIDLYTMEQSFQKSHLIIYRIVASSNTRY